MGTREALNIPEYRIGLTPKNDLALTVDSAMVEKSWCKIFFLGQKVSNEKTVRKLVEIKIFLIQLLLFLHFRPDFWFSGWFNLRLNKYSIEEN